MASSAINLFKSKNKDVKMDIIVTKEVNFSGYAESLNIFNNVFVGPNIWHGLKSTPNFKFYEKECLKLCKIYNYDEIKFLYAGINKEECFNLHFKNHIANELGLKFNLKENKNLFFTKKESFYEGQTIINKRFKNKSFIFLHKGGSTYFKRLMGMKLHEKAIKKNIPILDIEEISKEFKLNIFTIAEIMKLSKYLYLNSSMFAHIADSYQMKIEYFAADKVMEQGKSRSLIHSNIKFFLKYEKIVLPNLFLKRRIFTLIRIKKFINNKFFEIFTEIKFHILLLILYKTKRKDNLYSLISEKNFNIFENIHYLKMRSISNCFYQELINILLKKLALKESNIGFYLKCERLNLLFSEFKIFIKNHKYSINKSTSKYPQCIRNLT